MDVDLKETGFVDWGVEEGEEALFGRCVSCRSFVVMDELCT